MGTKGGVGFSINRDPKEAGREAATKALAAAGLQICDFVMVYATIGYDQQQVVRSVREVTGKAELGGCSAEGVIAGLEVDESNFSVGVMVIQSDEVRFKPVLVEGLKADSQRAGRNLAEAAQPHLAGDTFAMLAIGDGLTLNFDKFIQGFEKSLGRPMPVYGGTAADNFEMVKTYQYCNDRVVSDAVLGIVCSGRGRIASGVNHGCVPIDVQRTVTRAEGNVIYEIDGKPMLEVLKEYLLPDEINNWEKTVVNLCLGFKAPKDMEKEYDEFLIRFMPARDEKAGSITIPTEVTNGTPVWMTRRDHDKMANGLDSLAKHIRNQLGGRVPKLVFHFDCAGRGKFIFREQEKRELMAKLQRDIAPNVPWLGFYTFGEIGPIAGKNCFHNYTAVICAIY